MITKDFWKSVDKKNQTSCWPWNGLKNKGGYGVFWNGIKQEAAHRISYRLLVGEIKSGLTIDHLCRNRICVNPSHLEAVTTMQNVLRGIGPTAINKRKIKCNRGHEYNNKNTLYFGKRNYRNCRKCCYIRLKAYRKRSAERLMAGKGEKK